MIRSAELVSERDDILYGSFRIAMKTSSIDGTCAAFFFYRNDSQEIDTEILSSQQRSAVNSWPIHLVVQNTTPSTDGPVDYRGSVQDVYNLSSSLRGGTTGNYNEYRFDWLPDRISYYVNGQHAWTTTENVPSTAGQIHISHWSNGNPLWSGGPPEQDAVLTVSYVKAYFNSTNSTRDEHYRMGCRGAGQGETCKIPTQLAPPNPFGSNGNETGHTFFFSQQRNMTPGQTVYSTPLESLGMPQIRPFTAWLIVVVVALLIHLQCSGL
jgi:beta-glucanase (GH16 family)